MKIKSLKSLFQSICIILLYALLQICMFSMLPPEARGQETEDTLLYPANLIYKGAFAFPEGDHWTYGGHALAYYPYGDPSGSDDGYPGSLYAVGHAWNNLVGEISIPQPLVSKDYDSLPKATVLQDQSDITGGHINHCRYYDQNGQEQECEYREVAGLEYLDNINKIAWNLRDWYNVTEYDLDSLGWSNTNMTNAQGVWHIGERFSPDNQFHNGKTCNYLFKASKNFASQYLEGKWLISGNHRTAGAFGGGQGPSIYASAPWTHGNPPEPGTEIDALALVFYPEVIPCIEDPNLCYYPGYRVDDSWGGGAWVEAGKKSGVLIFGRKGIGDNYYGIGREGDCSSDKGYHSDPYQPQILFFNPAELAQVAAGAKKPWEVFPYNIYVPENEIFNFKCGEFVSVAYDPDRNFIYAVEQTWTEKWVIHVWEVTSENGSATEVIWDVDQDKKWSLPDIIYGLQVLTGLGNRK